MVLDILAQYFALTIFTAWLISVLIKLIIVSYKQKKFLIMAGFENGGMPSSHATLMSSITFAILLTQGFTPLFFLAIVLSALILRDAVTVRREVGLIGETLNKILIKQNKETLKVVYGHTLKQVCVGILIGLLFSIIFYSLLF